MSSPSSRSRRRPVGSAALQLSCAAVVGAGIAIARALLPVVVKTRYADRAGLVTGIYTAGLGLGGAVAAGVSTPLADALGSWRAGACSRSRSREGFCRDPGLAVLGFMGGSGSSLL